MTFRNTEYLILVNIDGTFRTGQVKRVQVAQDGTAFPATPVDFPQADLSGLLDGFNADLLRENVGLKAERAKERGEHSSAITTLQDSVKSLTGQLVTAQAAAADGQQASAQLAELQQQVGELQNRVAVLLAQLPFDPRKITVSAFLNRLSQAELLMLFSEEDPIVQSIAKMLKDWAANDWPIELDSKQFMEAIAYLVQAGKLGSERVWQMAADATRSESPTLT